MKEGKSRKLKEKFKELPLRLQKILVVLGIGLVVFFFIIFDIRGFLNTPIVDLFKPSKKTVSKDITQNEQIITYQGTRVNEELTRLQEEYPDKFTRDFWTIVDIEQKGLYNFVLYLKDKEIEGIPRLDMAEDESIGIYFKTKPQEGDTVVNYRFTDEDTRKKTKDLHIETYIDGELVRPNYRLGEVIGRSEEVLFTADYYTTSPVSEYTRTLNQEEIISLVGLTVGKQDKSGEDSIPEIYLLFLNRGWANIVVEGYEIVEDEIHLNLAYGRDTGIVDMQNEIVAIKITPEESIGMETAIIKEEIHVNLDGESLKVIPITEERQGIENLASIEEMAEIIDLYEYDKERQEDIMSRYKER